ncbi:MAG: cell wall anchor protein [Oscillospiraceae bacterium]|jgi:hypothetical protein|nr:cell wall anchor protein [Oscillospiraceae bacterium]
MKRQHPKRLACMLAVICVLLSCGLTAFAADEAPQTAATPLPPYPEDMRDDLYPADVQTVISDGTRQIVKTYILTAGQTPADIPRENFTRDGWRYTLTDITEKRTSGTETRSHTETVELSTDTKDLNEIIKLLSPSLEYQSADSFSGTLTLDMASVKCEAAGYKNSSYTVTATREYPHLSANDTSLIPKTITDNGRTLQLDDVTWEVQNYTNVDYQDIPDSYRAVAKYTAKASKSVVTGYVTTADYTGEIVKAVTGDTLYIAYFEGIEINPTPTPEPSTPTSAPEPTAPENGGGIPLVPILIGPAVLAALAGAGAFFFLRRNVKIYRDGFRVLAAKDKISAKNKLIDLSPLDGDCFGIEIEAFTAKALNGQTVEIRYGADRLKHRIAFEGSAYRIEANFGAGTIQAVY